jgi:hypothetical protein
MESPGRDFGGVDANQRSRRIHGGDEARSRIPDDLNREVLPKHDAHADAGRPLDSVPVSAGLHSQPTFLIHVIAREEPLHHPAAYLRKHRHLVFAAFELLALIVEQSCKATS